MPTIVGIGESLFDIYPNGAQHLGGATLNFSVHAHQLQSRIGGHGTTVTRVGSDALGRGILDCLERFGMDTTRVQVDGEHPSGQVLVTISADGHPSYDILEGVAWDAIEFDDVARRLASSCDAVCFGTLAQRAPKSRSSIQQFVEAAPQAFRLCDINLRQHYFDTPVIQRSLELATAVKLNHEELEVLAGLLRLPGETNGRIAALLRDFHLDYIVLTRGERGTAIFTPDQEVDGPPVSYPPSPNADPVGAGDSCAAAVTVGLLMKWPLPDVAHFANHIGAYVASQPGGTPVLPAQLRVNPDCTLPVEKR
jgi:fructokinase